MLRALYREDVGLLEAIHFTQDFHQLSSPLSETDTSYHAQITTIWPNLISHRRHALACVPRRFRQAGYVLRIGTFRRHLCGISLNRVAMLTSQERQKPDSRIFGMEELSCGYPCTDSLDDLLSCSVLWTLIGGNEQNTFKLVGLIQASSSRPAWVRSLYVILFGILLTNKSPFKVMQALLIYR